MNVVKRMRPKNDFFFMLQMDWLKEKEPESDGDGYYHTSLPVIVFQMIEEHLQVRFLFS